MEEEERRNLVGGDTDRGKTGCERWKFDIHEAF